MKHLSMRNRIAAAVATAAVLALSGLMPATGMADVAPAPGIQIDPGSPAGKQYQIPITAARQETSGSKGTSQNGTQLFGSGITAPASSRPVARARAALRAPTHHRRPDARGPHTHRPASPPATTATAVRSSERADAQVGSTGWLPLAGGGVLVLLIGGLAGIVLRRRVT